MLDRLSPVARSRSGSAVASYPCAQNTARAARTASAVSNVWLRPMGPLRCADRSVQYIVDRSVQKSVAPRAARTRSPMVIAGLVLTGVAALLHVVIFYLESIAWTGERARATFGTGTVEQAAAQQQLAFNQGFYNLFLAIAVALGIALVLVGQTAVGATLVLTGAGSMVAAAVVLLVSSPDKAPAALKQGVIPALGVVALVVGLVL